MPTMKKQCRVFGVCKKKQPHIHQADMHQKVHRRCIQNSHVNEGCGEGAGTVCPVTDTSLDLKKKTFENNFFKRLKR